MLRQLKFQKYNVVLLNLRKEGYVILMKKNKGKNEISQLNVSSNIFLALML